MSEQMQPTVGGFIERASKYVAEALRYWEPRRLFYNAVLAVVVAAHMISDWPKVREMFSLNVLLLLFLLAVLANVCYCTIYAVDLFVRFSGLQVAWDKGRPIILLIGSAFAAVLTHFFVTGIFSQQ